MPNIKAERDPDLKPDISCIAQSQSRYMSKHDLCIMYHVFLFMVMEGQTASQTFYIYFIFIMYQVFL